MSAPHVPLRPCGVCRQPYPDGDCPRHPRRGGYRPNRPSIVNGAYRGPWPRIRATALLACRGVCVYCATEPATTGDHVVPTSRGGRTELRNVVGACSPCNTSKGARTLAEWVRSGTSPVKALAVMAERIRQELPV